MYEYLDGQLVLKSPTHVIIDVGGVGYHVHISLTTYSQIKEVERCKIFISFQVREDSQTMYGFATESERHLFNHLISVSGIGPNTGRMMLSSITPEEIQNAIVQGQVAVIQRIKGIGPKTAQRVILELQDKLKKEGPNALLMEQAPSLSTHEEASSALIMLGFSKQQVEKVIQQVLLSAEDLTVEGLIKAALKKL
ncbi:Holliday junction branch migration protein RuvA [Sphingobacterium corticis]|uniref:Holliday junction branch migration complex subunit RuvA n=1 Tax=Sphingobacterium corticis TaxID=1812823 RepID=A0ABW5NLY6_9SPHI